MSCLTNISHCFLSLSLRCYQVLSLLLCFTILCRSSPLLNWWSSVQGYKRMATSSAVQMLSSYASNQHITNKISLVCLPWLVYPSYSSFRCSHSAASPHFLLWLLFSFSFFPIQNVFGYLSSYVQIASTFLQMAPSWPLLDLRIFTSQISLVLERKGPCERSPLDKEMGPGSPKFLRQNLQESWKSNSKFSPCAAGTIWLSYHTRPSNTDI